MPCSKKLKTIVPVLCLFVFGCTQNTAVEPDTTAPEESVATSDDSVTPKDASATVGTTSFEAFTANGNEPGWRLDVARQEDAVYYELMTAYGEITLYGRVESVTDQGRLVLDVGSEKMPLIITSGQCYDAAEQLYTTSVEFTYTDIRHVGCGDYQDRVTLEKAGQNPASGPVHHYICFTRNDDP